MKQRTKTALVVIFITIMVGGMFLDIFLKWQSTQPAKVATFYVNMTEFVIWDNPGNDETRQMEIHGNGTIEYYVAISELREVVNSSETSHFVGWVPDPLIPLDRMMMARIYNLNLTTGVTWHREAPE